MKGKERQRGKSKRDRVERGQREGERRKEMRQGGVGK